LARRHIVFIAMHACSWVSLKVLLVGTSAEDPPRDAVTGVDEGFVRKQEMECDPCSALRRVE